MTERCQKAYNSLVRAFFEGTLAKFTCLGCACGNIIHDAVGEPITKEDLEDEIIYINEDYPAGLSEEVKRRVDIVHEKILQAEFIWSSKRKSVGLGYVAYDTYEKEVNAAGYTAAEFARIETAFERNTHFKLSTYPIHSEQEILEDQYNGLCAVVDVLLELDKDEEQSSDKLKQEFRKHPKLLNYAV